VVAGSNPVTPTCHNPGSESDPGFLFPAASEALRAKQGTKNGSRRSRLAGLWLALPPKKDSINASVVFAYA